MVVYNMRKFHVKGKEELELTRVKDIHVSVYERIDDFIFF